MVRAFAKRIATRLGVRLTDTNWPGSVQELVLSSRRPLLAGVVWPNLPAEVLERFADLNILLSAVYLRRLESTIPPEPESPTGGTE